MSDLDLSDLAMVELDRLEEHLTRAQRSTAGITGPLDLGCFADALSAGADVRAEQARRQWRSADAIERYVRLMRADNKYSVKLESE